MVVTGIGLAFAGIGQLLRRPLGRRMPDVKGVNTVLLIRLDLLGDVVFSLQAVRTLKTHLPRARVMMLTLPQTSPVPRLSPDVDEVVSLDTNALRSPSGLLRKKSLTSTFDTVKRLRQARPDLAVSLYGQTGSALALFSGARWSAGFDSEAYPSTLDKRVPGGRRTDRQRLHDTEQSAKLLSDIGVTNDRTPHQAPIIDASGSESRVGRTLDELGVASEARLVVFHAGSGYGDFKRWPAASFAELAKRLDARGFQCLVVGSPSDAGLASEIASTSPAVSLAGRTTLEQLAALFQRVDLVVSGDSGPLHLATSVGTPAVAIYGPTDPLVNGPRPWHGQPIRVLRRDIVCSPCYSVRSRAECPLGDPICVRLVTVDEVCDAALSILTSRTSVPARVNPEDGEIGLPVGRRHGDDGGVPASVEP